MGALPRAYATYVSLLLTVHVWLVFLVSGVDGRSGRCTDRLDRQHKNESNKNTHVATRGADACLRSSGGSQAASSTGSGGRRDLGRRPEAGSG